MGLLMASAASWSQTVFLALALRGCNTWPSILPLQRFHDVLSGGCTSVSPQFPRLWGATFITAFVLRAFVFALKSWDFDSMNLIIRNNTAEANACVLFILEDTKDYFWKMKSTFHQHFIRIQFCCSPLRWPAKCFCVITHWPYTFPSLCV